MKRVSSVHQCSMNSSVWNDHYVIIYFQQRDKNEQKDKMMSLHPPISCFPDPRPWLITKHVNPPKIVSMQKLLSNFLKPLGLVVLANWTQGDEWRWGIHGVYFGDSWSGEVLYHQSEFRGHMEAQLERHFHECFIYVKGKKSTIFNEENLFLLWYVEHVRAYGGSWPAGRCHAGA